MKKTTSAMLALVIFLMLFASGCVDDRPAMTPDWTAYHDQVVKGNAVPVRVDGKWGVMGLDGEYYIEPQFKYIDEFVNGAAVVVFEKGGYALVDTKGRVLWRGDYLTDRGDYYGFSDEMGLMLARKDGKCGLLSRDGKYVVKPLYGYIDACTPTGEIAARKDGKWGFIDLENNVKVDFRFDDIDEVSVRHGICAVSENGKWGIIDMSGDYIAEPQYDRLWMAWKHNWFAAQKDGKWGFVDLNGVVKVEFQYDRVFDAVGEYTYLAEKEGVEERICEDMDDAADVFNVRRHSYRAEGFLCQGVSVVYSKTVEQYGAQNAAGEWVVPPEYDVHGRISFEDPDVNQHFWMFHYTEEGDSWDIGRRGIAQLFDKQGEILLEVEMKVRDFGETCGFGLPKF